MRRAVLATILGSACSFQHGSASETGVPPPYPDAGRHGGDAAPTTDAPTGDAPTTTAAKCHSSLPGIRVCLDFEPTAFTTDDSGLAHTVDLTSVSQTTRGTQGAADLTPDSTISVEPRSDLDVSPKLTMEMWVEPHSLPSRQETGWLLSNSDAYGLWLTDRGLTCGVSSLSSNISTTASVLLPIDQWTHVACVYDGTTLNLYVNGDAAACLPQSLTIADATGAAINIMTFDGAVDDVHLYAAALSGQDICDLATGGTGCNSFCP